MLHADGRLARRVNPLILEGTGDIKALDAKIIIDDNSLFPSARSHGMRDFDEEDPNEIAASKFGLPTSRSTATSAAWSTAPAWPWRRWTRSSCSAASRQLPRRRRRRDDREGDRSLQDRDPATPMSKGILVNIFGGIMKCDTIANGVIAAVRETQLNVPLVGAHEGDERGTRQTDAGTPGLPIIPATMAEAAEKIVAAVK